MQLGIEIVEMHHSGLVWDIRLPESVADEMSSRRTRWRITLDRTWGTTRSDIHMLDLDSPLMRLMLRRAKAYEFGGRTLRSDRIVGRGARRCRAEVAERAGPADAPGICDGEHGRRHCGRDESQASSRLAHRSGRRRTRVTCRFRHQTLAGRRAAGNGTPPRRREQHGPAPRKPAVDCGCVAGRIDRVKRSGQLSAPCPLADRLSSDASEGFSHATIEWHV